MRTRRASLLLLALVAACGGVRDRAHSDSARDSAGLGTALAAAPAAAPFTSPRPVLDRAVSATAADSASDSIPPVALCAEVAAAAGKALQLPFTRDSGTTFPSPRDGPPWRGCRMRAEGSVRPYSEGSAMPEPRLLAAMKRAGWAEDIAFDAGGPEGSSFALRRGGTLCHYDTFFPGTPGDDDEGAADTVVAAPDTTRPPLPYVVKILCTRGLEARKRASM